MEELYSRTVTVEQVNEREIQSFLADIAKATDTSARDIQKDLDGNDMFLYSNNDVVVLVQRTFDTPCGPRGCSWDVGISSTDTELARSSQKEVVDAAFISLSTALSD